MMRTYEEILVSTLENREFPNFKEKFDLEIIIELLLDIRRLLEKLNETE